MATCIMKPSDVYTRRPDIPEGWVYDGFRFTKKGDYYLSEITTGQYTVHQALVKHILPAIIVKKAGPPTETSQRCTFLVSVTDIYGEPFPSIPEGWVRVDFRLPQDGENYLTPSSDPQLEILCKTSFYKVWGPRIILEREPPQTSVDWWE